jgi:Predicted acetyltransferase
MYTKKELIESIKKQLSIEYNCTSQDFSSSENILTAPRNNPGRRQYIDGKFFFKMVTLGQNSVISAEESIHPWLKEYINGKTGHWLFEHLHLCEIDNHLKKYDKKLWQTHHMYLPDMNIIQVTNIAEVRWFEKEEIHQFYDTKAFPNALCESFDPRRPDILAVCAYDGRKIMGMAGCSADTPDLWQIGIDVDVKYRGKGLGTYLVTLLKNEVIQRGKIPFYGTSLSNLQSQNIALKSGFFPAWVEVETIED